MLQSLGLLFTLLGVTAFTGAQEIATTAASPQELAQFVATHHDFDWAPLWKALDVANGNIFLPRCEVNFDGVAPCSSELITVVDPLEAILILEHKASGFQVFLRYQSSGPGSWQFGGAFAPRVKYFPPEHRITYFGKKPFFIVTEQGISGTGVSSKIENWIDLTAKEFSPVLSFTAEGQYASHPNGIGRKTGGRVVSLVTQPVERVTVGFDVEFESVGNDGSGTPVVHRTDRVVFVRTGSGLFEQDQSLSTATAQEVAEFYDSMDDPDVSAEEFLRFNFKGLIALAASKDSESISWLSDFIRRFPDAPESRQLKALIAAQQ